MERHTISNTVVEAFEEIASSRGFNSFGVEIVNAGHVQLQYDPHFRVNFEENFGIGGKVSSITVTLFTGDMPEGDYIEMLSVLNEFMMWSRSADIPLFWGHLGLEAGLRSSGFPGDISRVWTMDYEDEKVLEVFRGEEQILIEHREGNPVEPYSISIFVSEDATERIKQKVQEWLDAAPDMFSVSVVPLEGLRDRVDAIERWQPGKKKKGTIPALQEARRRMKKKRNKRKGRSQWEKFQKAGMKSQREEMERWRKKNKRKKSKFQEFYDGLDEKPRKGKNRFGKLYKAAMKRKREEEEKWRKKNSSSAAKSNRGGFAQSRYILRDLDDENFSLPFYASSNEEAMIEARRLVGNRTGNYCVTRTEEV